MCIRDSGNTAFSAKLNADEKTLLTINGYLKDGKYYYQIPELSSSYISMDLSQIIEEAFSETDSLVNGIGNKEDSQPVINKMCIRDRYSCFR